MVVLNKFFKIVISGVIILTTWLGVFWIINLIPSKMMVERNNGVETTFKKLKEIPTNKSYTDTFVAVNNGLNRIDVLFKNPNLESRDELQIKIIDENKKLIYKQDFTGFNFGDTSHARLDFVAIVDSKNKTYSLEIWPIKIVDGKLAFGLKNSNVDLVSYYNLRFDIKRSVSESINLVKEIVVGQPIVFILPWLLLIILLW